MYLFLINKCMALNGDNIFHVGSNYENNEKL